MCVFVIFVTIPLIVFTLLFYALSIHVTQSDTRDTPSFGSVVLIQYALKIFYTTYLL